MSTSRVSIRFFGEALDPSVVTRVLGAEPTTYYRKGDKRMSPDGRVYEQKWGAWIIAAPERSPEAVDEQLAGLFGALTPDLEVWLALASRFDSDVFCGLFMDDSNEGFSLLPTTLRALADRQLEIGFDIYDPVDEDDDTRPVERHKG